MLLQVSRIFATDRSANKEPNDIFSFWIWMTAIATMVTGIHARSSSFFVPCVNCRVYLNCLYTALELDSSRVCQHSRKIRDCQRGMFQQRKLHSRKVHRENRALHANVGEMQNLYPYWQQTKEMEDFVSCGDQSDLCRAHRGFSMLTTIRDKF